jgi:hypothetical protein
MQRGGKGGVGFAINGEMDVAQLVGCGVAVVRVEGSAEKVLARPEEPEEGDDREVEKVRPALAHGGVGSVEGVDEGLEDGDVDWVRAGRRPVFLSESLAIFGPDGILGGRWLCRGVLGTPRVGSTQLDDLVACRSDLVKYGSSPDRLTTGAGGSVFDTVHDEEQVLGVVVNHGIEGVGDFHFVAESGPSGEGFVLASLLSGGDGTAGSFETSADTTKEAVRGGR